MALDPALKDWLLDSDPTLRWQVERDLLAEPDEVWRATRARIATEGDGARLLAHQDADGQWAGGAYFPAEQPPPGPGQPWTATTWTLNTLRDWGLDARALDGTAELLDANSRWEYDELPYWGGEVDCCINAFTLSNGTWLGADVHGIAEWFLEHQLSDGGWNCEWVEGSTRSSFHSTINSIEALLYYERATGESAELRDARHRAEEYLLERRLLHSLTTGEVHEPWATHFAYPFRHAYSALRAADYFRRSSAFDFAATSDATEPSERDERIRDAVDVVRDAREPDGTWLQRTKHEGEVWFDLDVAPGEPSKWLTLYGTRVLDWWDATKR